MTAATPSRLGQINAAGDVRALFLKVFAGEVLTAFNTKTVFAARHRIRTIASGKSAQFPATGKTTAAYHTPGAEIVGTPINSNERVITIDDILLADVFVADIDELVSHYDVRGPYSEQLGQALAQAFDSNVAQVMVLAARAAATITGLTGGSVINGGATMKTDASVIAAGLFTAAQKMDEADVPEEGRSAFFKPAQYYLMAQNTALINKDWDGRGSYAAGTIHTVAGIELVKTNKLPTGTVATGPTAYQGVFTNTAGVVTTMDAVGTVKLMDVSVRSDYDPRRVGELMVAKSLCGHGILRPECAVELSAAV